MAYAAKIINNIEENARRRHCRLFSRRRRSNENGDLARAREIDAAKEMAMAKKWLARCGGIE